MKARDYYELLCLPRNANIVDIKRAYRRLIRQYHPDVVPQTPETLRSYQELTHAYEVLSDPYERAAYDRKLPKQQYPIPNLPPDALWREVTQVALQKSDRFGPLQQAMRAAVVVAREGNTIVLGLAGQHQYLAGHMQTAGNRHFVCEVLAEVSGEELEFRLIEGTTAEDWEVVKKSEAIALQKATRERPAAPPVMERPAPRRAAPSSEPEAQPAPPAQEPEPAPAPARGSTTWDELKGRLESAWGRVAGPRQSPTARANFIAEAIPLLYEAEQQALDHDEPDQGVTRQLNRAIERVALAAEVPPAVVALELLRYRRERPL